MTDALKAELARQISAGEVLVVVGTGVSRTATEDNPLASWKGLIRHGVKRCVDLGLADAKWAARQEEAVEGDQSDLLGVAEQVSNRLGWKKTEPCGGDWNEWLRMTVGSLRPQQRELIEVIADIGAPITTLNYDNLLGDVISRPSVTWQEAEHWLPVLRGKDQAILHLHGHWRRPSSVVLGIRSYDAVLNAGLAQHLERALVSLRSFLFVGCGGTFADPNFAALLLWMREHVSGAEHRHYLLVRRGEALAVAEDQLRAARITPLPYGNAHSDLLSFLRGIAPQRFDTGSGGVSGASPNHSAATSTAQTRPHLLPVSPESPLLLGVAVDVSGSMQTLMQSDIPEGTSRLQSALSAMRDLSISSSRESRNYSLNETADIVKLFAYGFGFSDRAIKLGNVANAARRIFTNIPPIPVRRFSGRVRDLFDISGLTPSPINLRKLLNQWSEFEAGIWEQRIDLFGETPMREALGVLMDAFITESKKYPGTPSSVLIIISDGKSKDGSPIEYAEEMKANGTIIMSGYLTEDDIAEPKTLYSQPQPGWPEGALTLYKCANVLAEEAALLPSLLITGWKAKEGDKLFVQINQSEHLSEFLLSSLDVASMRGTDIK